MIHAAQVFFDEGIAVKVGLSTNPVCNGSHHSSHTHVGNYFARTCIVLPLARAGLRLQRERSGTFHGEANICVNY